MKVYSLLTLPRYKLASELSYCESRCHSSNVLDKTIYRYLAIEIKDELDRRKSNIRKYIGDNMIMPTQKVILEKDNNLTIGNNSL